MSRPRLSAGICVGRYDARVGRALARRELVVDDDVGRQHDPHARSPRRGRGSRGTVSSWSSSSRLLPTSWPCGGEEREHHAAADQQRVGRAQQVVDHAELVGDLRAAEHHHVGPFRVGGQPAQHVELARDQAAHRGREPLRDVVHRGLLAVDDAEAVGDERVGERGQLVGESARSASSLLVSPALNRTFSSSATSPSCRRGDGRLRSARPPCRWRTRPPGPAAPRAVPRRDAASTSSGAPFGRPRCAVTTTLAPASESSRIVGTLARIRPSSVIRLPSSGTLRSDRTSTRLPCTSPRRVDPRYEPRHVRGSRRRTRSGRRGGWSSPTRCRTSRSTLTWLPITLVSGASKMHDAGSVTMSVDTIGSVE